MRITGCHIEQFGQFERYTLDALDHPLVVILGPNETGKTTIFQFMVTMLYGFSPADASRHPYRPTDEKSLAGRMEFRSGNTQCSVERKLRSTPKGTLSIGSEGLFGREESIRNRPLRVTGDIPREVFEAIYALSLRDMAQVSGRAWNSIQDRLLGGLNLDTLRIAREVVDELNLEARKLWRPDRRGKTQAQALSEQLRRLRTELGDARERDTMIRSLNREVDEIRRQIEQLELEGRTLRKVKNRVERLLPVKARLDRIAYLTEVAGDPVELQCIPPDPRAELARLESEEREISAETEELARVISDREATASAIDESDERLESVAAEIRAWHARAALFTQRRLQVEEAETKLERLRARRDQLGARLLSDGWSPEAERALARISSPDLREAVRRYVRRKEELDLARARLEGLTLKASAAPAGVWWVILIVGLVLSIVGFVLGEAVVWGPAIAVAAVASGFVLQSFAHASDAAGRSGANDFEAAAAVTNAREAVIRLLGDIQLSALRREEPDPELASEIAALQSLLGEIDAEVSSAKSLREKLADDEAEVAGLLRLAGLDSPLQPEAELGRLFERLSDSESRRAAAAEANRTLPRDRERLDELQRQREDLRGGKADLVSRLAGLGDGDYVKGIDAAIERLRARERADAIQEELEAGYPDLGSILKELEGSGDSVPITQDYLIEVDEQLEAISRSLRDSHALVASHETRIRSLVDEKAVAEVESEAAVVEEQMIQVRLERDRLLLLANVIRHADARFRDRHQPDVIRRASDMVKRLTAGRYGRMEVDEEEGALSILEEHTGLRHAVGEPLSRGTLDQIYLALRLGLAEHLDSSGERLPLFLDEVLVNWDASRRKAAWGLLSDLSGTRQIMFFTCHEWLADEVEHTAGARVVKI